MGITTGPGGEELILAGDVTPCKILRHGEVDLEFSHPTRAAALAGIVTVPMVTFTPLNNVVETTVPAGDGAKPVA